MSRCWLIWLLAGTTFVASNAYASVSCRDISDLDEMEALGPVRLSEVQEAQKRIINTARRLSDEGSIVLAGRGGDDYV